MWLASGAAQAVENIILTGACTFASSDNFFDGFSDDPRAPDNSFQNICGEARAIAAFSFLNWLIRTSRPFQPAYSPFVLHR
jgi:hypothetical protein